MSEQTAEPSGIQVELHADPISTKKTRVRLILDWMVEGNALNTDLISESRKALEWALRGANS